MNKTNVASVITRKPKPQVKRSLRIDRLAAKLAARSKERNERTRVFSRSDSKMKPIPYMAYDLETSNIEAGNPTVKYLTVHGEDLTISASINSIEHLREILETRLLTTDRNRTRYVAWNGNRFDAYFIARALMLNPDYIIKPYLTRKKSLRGMLVCLIDHTGKLKPKDQIRWEFLDGIAMTGIQKPLKAFLKTFAPNYEKLDLDFDKEEFDAANPQHRLYAERDSEGLYHALVKCNAILTEHFDAQLTPTIGKLGIRIFQSHIPPNTSIFSPPKTAEKIIREQLMRGGYCHCARKFTGKTWKYDINQAYASAMRDSRLPLGRCVHISVFNTYAKAAMYRVNATNKANIVPLYIKDQDGQATFATTEIADSWLTQSELLQLRAEKWQIKIIEGYYWETFFSMKEYVDKLENLRINGEGGTKGALGEIVKSIGNNSYGKTAEELWGLNLVMAYEKPEGFSDYYSGEETEENFIWFNIGEKVSKSYHQPQLASFITAHVRMQVRRAIMLAPKDWLYADTDCVAFTRPVDLPIDPGIYGTWKIESDGDIYRFIDKKVYASIDGKEKKAKGMNTKNLSDDDFTEWFKGNAPIQHQVHRQSFIKTMGGANMFIDRDRSGTRAKV